MSTQTNVQTKPQHLQLTGTKNVPANAMQFEAPLQFADGEHEGSQTAPIMMLGRSAQPIYHWYWGKIIHDMSGFNADHKRIPIDWAHDAYEDEGIGYLDKFKADNTGLHVEGELVSVKKEDRADTIMKKSALGVPYQASIYFRAEVVEEVKAGASAKVNGYTVEGPATIVRKWGLRGMAVCLYGADHRTQSQFSDDGDQTVAVSYFTAETQMSTGNNANPNPAASPDANTLTQGQASQQTPGGDESSGNLSGGNPSQLTDTNPAGQPGQQNPGTGQQAETQLTDGQGKPEGSATQLSDDDPRSQLKRYIAKFGAENGANWFAEGLSFEKATEKHVEVLNAASAEKDKSIEELKQKLSAIDRGEPDAVSFNSNDSADKSSDVPEKFSQLGENVGRFAAGIKLPK